MTTPPPPATQPKCGTTTCDKPPTMEVFWPGRAPLKMCDLCAARAQHIGAVMGSPITVRPLPEEPTDEV